MCSLEVSNAFLCTQKAEGGHKDCEQGPSQSEEDAERGGDGRREGGRETERKRVMEGGRDALNT